MRHQKYLIFIYPSFIYQKVITTFYITLILLLLIEKIKFLN
jgi:hypothetical protein